MPAGSTVKRPCAQATISYFAAPVAGGIPRQSEAYILTGWNPGHLFATERYRPYCDSQNKLYCGFRGTDLSSLAGVIAMSNTVPKLRVLIADDSEHFRHALAGAIDGYCEICGEASNGVEAVEKVQALNPDLVFLDIYMPELRGGAAAMEIRRLAPNTLIVFVSIEDDPSVADMVKNCGADGFVNKAAGAGAFRKMLRVLGHRSAA